MLKSLTLAATATTLIALSAASTAAIADAKPANELVQAGFKKHFRLHIHVGGYGPAYGGYYDGYGYGCRHLYRKWRHTGAWLWRKRYLRCIGAI